MFNKLVTSSLSLAVLLFGSYKGNNAKFVDLEVYETNKSIIIQSELNNAFKNDFKKIFKSGEKITIWFDLKIRNHKKVVKKSNFRHTVIYDPIDASFQLFLEDTRETLNIKDYEDLLIAISNIEFECVAPNLKGEVEITLEAYLETINLKSMKKEFNLMALWKFKRPTIQAYFRT